MSLLQSLSLWLRRSTDGCNHDALASQIGCGSRFSRESQIELSRDVTPHVGRPAHPVHQPRHPAAPRLDAPQLPARPVRAQAGASYNLISPKSRNLTSPESRNLTSPKSHKSHNLAPPKSRNLTSPNLFFSGGSIPSASSSARRAAATLPTTRSRAPRSAARRALSHFHLILSTTDASRTSIIRMSWYYYTRALL